MRTYEIRASRITYDFYKVEAYIGMPLARLEYCKNQPHKLTSFK